MHLYNKEVRTNTRSKSDFFSLRGLKITLIALKNLFSIGRVQTKKNIFLGASTSFFTHHDKTLDAYFPYYDLETKDVIYMVNCGNLDQLYEFLPYVHQNHIIVENYLFGVVKKVISKILYVIKSAKNDQHFNNVNLQLSASGIELSSRAVVRSFYDFVAGYHVYRSVFKRMNIDKAYIVSPTTKSDMCAALKSLNIEIIEVQHGVVGKPHRGYNFSFPQDMRLPVPDQINVYNTFWKNEIIAAGYFTNEQINIVGRLKYDIVEEIAVPENKAYLIFTGQGAYISEIVDFLLGSVALLEQNNLKLIYKPHPRELVEELQFIHDKIDPYDVLELYEGELTTETLIKNALAHVSIFSSCHFDAIYFNDKTYILDIMPNNMMQYYHDNYPEKFVTITTMADILKDLGKIK